MEKNNENTTVTAHLQFPGRVLRASDIKDVKDMCDDSYDDKMRVRKETRVTQWKRIMKTLITCTQIFLFYLLCKSIN